MQGLVLYQRKELICCQTCSCEALNFYSHVGTVFLYNNDTFGLLSAGFVFLNCSSGCGGDRFVLSYS